MKGLLDGVGEVLFEVFGPCEECIPMRAKSSSR